MARRASTYSMVGEQLQEEFHNVVLIRPSFLTFSSSKLRFEIRHVSLRTLLVLNCFSLKLSVINEKGIGFESLF